MKITENTLRRRADAVELPSTSASIADRLKYLILFTRKTQAQFAAELHIDPATLSKLLSGRLDVSKRMASRISGATGCDRDWLVLGTGIPFPRTATPSTVVREICRGVSAITDPEVCRYEMIGAPVYDIDVTAGHDALAAMFTDEHIVGRLFLPSINPASPIVRVSGESMKPQIPDGSYISIRPIANDSTIFWGQPYLVVTDDYRMVKVLRRHPDESKILPHSFNPEFDDIELPRDQIRHLFVVQSVITYNIFG